MFKTVAEGVLYNVVNLGGLLWKYDKMTRHSVVDLLKIASTPYRYIRMSELAIAFGQRSAAHCCEYSHCRSSNLATR